MATTEEAAPVAADILTPELEAFISKWQPVPGSLIMVLHKVQEHFGYVPRSVAFQVAEQLKVPLAQVYGVLTFYHYFKLEKPGQFQIAVCMGTACYLKGGADLIQELENILGVGLNTVTPDGLFSVEAVRCLGCCGLAPVLAVNGTVHGNLKREDVAEIIAQYKAKATAEA
ncbi:MAG: NAD(P)H-dependent oxidoreductase subunit E [Kiritimatiellae bacterium]|jgi:NADH-quinone oxidoreductase subunit E|nr:NAD(P)H-dependent oxidoreductase subunit E [Kiritimatiellia bacterium]MDD4342487.1 NAD(P)H-dependent oxidoreductase subunit E [Kiritimatiellia bacterium]MDY0149813.1 NAD(P)H-dependent oxidoreductase subunit E [Kiritimatiellia bacterium]